MVIALPLAGEAVALVAILLIAAVVLLGGLLGALMQRLPWPLAQIGYAIVRPWEDIVTSQVQWAQSSAQAFAQSLGALFINPWYAIGDVQGAVTHVIWALWRIRYQAIPNALNQAQAFAAQQATAVAQYALALAQANTRIAWAIGQQAEAFAAQQATAVAEYALALAQRNTQIAQSLFGRAETDAAAGIAGAEGYAQALQRQALGYAQGLFGQAIGHADQVGVDAEGYAQALQKLALGYAGQVGAEAIAHADAVGVRAEEYAQALAVPIATAVTAIEDSPCMRACGPLGDIGQLIQQLEGAGFLALLLELLREAESQPAEVATMLDRVFTGPAREAYSSLGG